MQRKMDKVIENIYTMEEQNRRRQMEEKITGEEGRGGLGGEGRRGGRGGGGEERGGAEERGEAGGREGAGRRGGGGRGEEGGMAEGRGGKFSQLNYDTRKSITPRRDISYPPCPAAM